MSQPRERPILFSGAMVRAILDGRKTQTRRVVRLVGADVVEERDDTGTLWPWQPQHDEWIPCPYGVPGDQLWVREAHAIVPRSAYWHDATIPHRVHVDDMGDEWSAVYRAGWERSRPGRWRPSIHMPRWASRITLEIVSVRVERLQDISESDARAEGVDWAAPHPYGERWTDDDREDPREVGYPPANASFARDNLRRLWDSINGKGAWDSNPWVWVVEWKTIVGGT